MTAFLHTHDAVANVDTVWIGTFQMTLVEFTDAVNLPAFPAATPYEGLPEGMVWRRYQPGVRHRFSDGLNQSDGPMPWSAGDDYVANAAAIQATVEAARAGATPPDPDDEARADALLDLPLTDSMIEALAVRFSISKATLRAEIRAILVDHPDL